MHSHYTGVLVLPLLLLWGGSHLHAQPSPPPISASTRIAESIYFYDGDTRVDLSLALDELAINGGTSSASPRASLTRTYLSRGRADLISKAARLSAANGGAEAKAVLYRADANRDTPQLLTRRLSVKWKHSGNAARLAEKYGLRILENVDYSPRTQIAEPIKGGPLAALDAANKIYESGDAEFATPLLERTRAKRAIPNDTLFPQQWHLRNTGSNALGAVAGNDINVTSVWDSNVGEGINIGITDDGLELDHPDLIANVRTDIDIDFNDGDDDPSHFFLEDSHGTSCAGVAAGRGFNGLGICGAAPEASLVGIRLVSTPVTDAVEAKAMTHQSKPSNAGNTIHINSNSWGPADDGQTIEGAGPLMRSALATAASSGRQGKGVVFVWAAGNGAQAGDDSNYDGYANNPNVIAVAATGANGMRSFYSEPGANVFVNAPASDDAAGITTTDRTSNDGSSPNDYWAGFGGTSSATPLVAGCVALMLKANQALTARDIKHLLARTSTRTDLADPEWVLNAAGIYHSRKYGFGRVNAAAAVTSASTWLNLPPPAAPVVASQNDQADIPDNDPIGVSRSINLSCPSNFTAEHVQVTVKVTHQSRGELEFFLTSPAGTTVKLAGMRNDSVNNYINVTFLSVATWGESANGNWQLRVADRAASHDGKLISWSIAVGGYHEQHDHDLFASVLNDTVKFKKIKTGGATMSASVSVGYFLAVPDKKAKADATLKYYLSDDETLDGSDTQIGESFVNGVKTTKPKTAKAKLTLSDADRGRYLLVALESLADQYAPNNVAAKLIPSNAF